MKKRVRSERVFFAAVLFFTILAASVLFSVIYKVGENIFVSQYIENLEESANKLGDHVAGGIDRGILAVLDYYRRTVDTGLASGFPAWPDEMGDLVYPVTVVELHDGSRILRDRWFSPEMDEKLREGFSERFVPDRPFRETFPYGGKVFIPFERILESESGNLRLRGLAVLDVVPFLSSLKFTPDAMVLVRQNRFYPVFGAPGRSSCLECHLGDRYREVFPFPHNGFIEERGLFLSGQGQGHRFVIDPVTLGGSDDSYILMRFPSEEVLAPLGAFRKLILPTWLLLSVVIVLGSVILYRRLREPAEAGVPVDLSLSDETHFSKIAKRKEHHFGGRRQEDGWADPERPPGELGARDRGGRSDTEVIEYGNGDGDTLETLKEVSEFLRSVNRITYPERVGDTMVWNLMNLIPGDLILLAVMGPEGPESEFDVFSAQRFRKDSVSEIFLKKISREFPSYVKKVIHERVVDVEEDPFFSRYSIYKHGLKKVLILPIETRGVILGVLSIFRKTEDRFSSFETGLATLLAGHLGTVIENTKLHEEVKSNYFNTLRAIVNAIEAKDRFRKGHSERVTDLALSIGDKVGLSQRRKNILFQAAVLHDIGKITIDPSVLTKKGKLTADEVSLIRQHPVIGYRIIEPLSFLREVKACISEHHERYNGEGYPSGTKKDDLTLEGRILSVADAFDSMTSPRPYRRAMTDREAIDELKRNAGGQFDPKVVQLFIEVYRERTARNLTILSGKEGS